MTDNMTLQVLPPALLEKVLAGLLESRGGTPCCLSMMMGPAGLVSAQWHTLCTSLQQAVWDHRALDLRARRAQGTHRSPAKQLDVQLGVAVEELVRRLEAYCPDSSMIPMRSAACLELGELEEFQRVVQLLEEGAGTSEIRNFHSYDADDVRGGTELMWDPRVRNLRNLATLFERLIRLVEEEADLSGACSSDQQAEEAMGLIDLLAVAPGHAMIENSFGLIATSQHWINSFEEAYGTIAGMCRSLFGRGYLWKMLDVSSSHGSDCVARRYHHTLAPRSTAALRLAWHALETLQLMGLDQQIVGDEIHRNSTALFYCSGLVWADLFLLPLPIWAALHRNEGASRFGCIVDPAEREAARDTTRDWKQVERCQPLARLRQQASRLLLYTTDLDSLASDLQKLLCVREYPFPTSCAFSWTLPRLDIFRLVKFARALHDRHGGSDAEMLRCVPQGSFKKGRTTANALVHCMLATYFGDRSGWRAFEQGWRELKTAHRQLLLQWVPDLLFELCRRKNRRALQLICDGVDLQLAVNAPAHLLAHACDQRGLVHRIVSMLLQACSFTREEVLLSLQRAQKVKNKKTIQVLLQWLAQAR